MKFLCPSCKAKYQIADEKVAGRSVRMKCRKCGHMIQVSTGDATAGSSVPPPFADDGAIVEAPSPTAAVVAPPRVEKSKPVASAPGRPPPPANKATLVGGAGAPVAPSASAVSATATPPPTKKRLPAPVKPAAPGAKIAPPPKPKPAPVVARANAEPASATGAARAPLRPAATGKAPLASTSALAANLNSPAVARSATLPMGAVAPRNNLVEDDGEEEPTRIADAGALAGAFSAAVAEHAPSVADPLNMPGDEWFVGINGVPVGPIRLSELRAKAASGAITKDSLVWRDGFEEWRALKNFPELAAIVEEGLSSTRASMPLPAGVAGSSGAHTAQPAALADPFASPASQPVSATPGGAVTGAGVVTDDIAGFRRRSGTSPAAWIAVVVALLFGITLGSVLFGRPPPVSEQAPKPAEKVDEKPASLPVVAKPDTVPEETVVSADPKAASRGSSAAAKSAAKTETDTRLTGGLKGLGLSGLAASGPRGPSAMSGNVPAAGGQLDAGQLQSTVARYTPSVKRGCWQPALDSRDKDAPASARVTAAITIAPSGTVQEVSTNGDPRGYRGLANCIAGRVRGWQFPASGSSTTVNVPFVFVAQ